MKKILLVALSTSLLSAAACAQAPAQQNEKPALSPHEVVNAAKADEWVKIKASDLLVMTLAPRTDGAKRQVIIQLLSKPLSSGHVDNIRTLAKAKWWDKTSINRVQDNYVVQWGDANYDNPASKEKTTKALPDNLVTVKESAYETPLDHPELWPKLAHVISQASNDDYAPTNGTDPYSNETSFVAGWPLGFGHEGTTWPIHCYAMVGVGRNLSPDTGTGAELYTVIGHAPRHLDRNIALAGRVIEGIEHLSSLPRGTGELGFYEKPEERVEIVSIRLGSLLPTAEQPNFEYMSTDSKSFADYAHARSNRGGSFFIKAAGGADVCNIPVPVRRVKAK